MAPILLSRRALHCLPLVLLILTMTGCGDNANRVVAVRGTVKVGGRPVSDLIVTFTPEKGLPSRGVTDEQGAFALRTGDGQNGAQMGDHKVSLQLRAAKEDKAIVARVATLASDPAIQQVLEKYGSADRTTLTRQVTENNQVIDLDLN